jgi:hypothetical protein
MQTLVGKREEERFIRGCKCNRDDNIKTDLEEFGCEDVDSSGPE